MLLSVCPDGKEKGYSYGGTASASGGRGRPTMALPTLVISSDPAVPTSIRTSGVRERQRQVMVKVTIDAITVIPIGPPRWVNPVAHCVLVGVRRAMARSSAGRSSSLMPSCSATAS